MNSGNTCVHTHMSDWLWKILCVLLPYDFTLKTNLFHKTEKKQHNSLLFFLFNSISSKNSAFDRANGKYKKKKTHTIGFLFLIKMLDRCPTKQV